MLLPRIAVVPIVTGALVDLPRLVRVGDWTGLGVIAATVGLVGFRRRDIVGG